MTDILVAGVGATTFGKKPEASVAAMTADAVAAALADAGLEPGHVDAAIFANTRQPILEGQNTIRAQIALRAAGIHSIPIFTVENACASGSTALWQADALIRSGGAERVLVVGAEKMVWPDRADAVAAAFLGGTDIGRVDEIRVRLEALGADLIPEGEAAPAAGRSFFMDSYAALARLHMKTFGTTRRQLAAAAAKNHVHSVHNPMAQYRFALSVEEVLADKPIVWPLTRAMCAPVSDGAAAAVLTRGGALAVAARRRAVRLRSVALVSAAPRAIDDYANHVGARAARAAYESARVAPGDIDLAEVHDATAFAEIQQIENLGLCGPGDGGAYTESGATALGGRTPVNVSGGLVSKGHPVGATGLAQIFELVLQLRGEAGPRQVENARLAVAENGGGFLDVEEAATVVTVLERPER